MISELSFLYKMWKAYLGWYISALGVKYFNTHKYGQTGSLHYLEKNNEQIGVPYVLHTGLAFALKICIS